MIDLIDLEKSLLLPHVKKGGVAVDFTMGNGHDTLWLSEAVGDDGHVYAFDIQPQAIENTRARLEEHGRKNCELICDSHSNVRNYVGEKICAGMFNLGYLPGSDKKITTMRPSTMSAVTAALELLGPDGGLLIAVYPGHEEGTLEGKMLDEFFAGLDRREICVSKLRIVNSPISPFFFLVEKK